MPQTAHFDQQHRATLQAIAERVMRERGLLPAFSPEVVAELEEIRAPAAAAEEPPGDAAAIRDMRGLRWASIDNDDSRDLDQLTVAEALPGHHVKVRVAVADVDALVKEGSAIDRHARHSTTSVFPMLPEKLSTDLTSLNPRQERWDRIVDLARQHGERLPAGADSAALDAFLVMSTDVQRGFIDFRRVDSDGH